MLVAPMMQGLDSTWLEKFNQQRLRNSRRDEWTTQVASNSFGYVLMINNVTSFMFPTIFCMSRPMWSLSYLFCDSLWAPCRCKSGFLSLEDTQIFSKSMRLWPSLVLDNVLCIIVKFFHLNVHFITLLSTIGNNCRLLVNIKLLQQFYSNYIYCTI